MWCDELRTRDRQHRAAMQRWEDVRATLPGTLDPSAAAGLTICSVAYKAKQCLELNHQLLRALNPATAPPTWLLFDNNDQRTEQFDAGDARFEVVRPAERMGFMGYEHALGLTALLPHIRTRFVLFLDPDCFIVHPGWVEDVLAHMHAHELAFFGTPINPRRHNSYRYFPYCVCMFVDLARVPLNELCLLPNVWRLADAVAYRMRESLAGLPRIGMLFRWLLTERWLTNGWRLRAAYGDHPTIRNECVQPVWDLSTVIPPGSLRKLLHDLTPASVSPIPKRAGYCSPVGFGEMGAPDIDALGWEEFVWHDAPFAFHVGSVHSSTRQPYELALREVCGTFMRLGPRPDPDQSNELPHPKASHS